MATGTIPQPLVTDTLRKIISIDLSNYSGWPTEYICNTLRQYGGAAFVLGWVRGEGILFLALTHSSGVVNVINVMTGTPYSSTRIAFSVTADGYLKISYTATESGHHQLLIIGN